MSEVVLSAHDIVKTYTTRHVFRPATNTTALDGVSLEIRTGEVVALIGESGSGKTTLGKVLCRLVRPDSGQIVFQGSSFLDLSARELLLSRRSIQMLFQNQTANLHPKMTLEQMLDESLRLHRPEMRPAERQEVASGLLSRVGLSERGGQRPASLSGGEKRRAGLARILATRPQLIIADEPTSGLDAAIKLQMIELLKELKEDSMTYLIISHDLSLVQRIADRIIVMLKGQIVEELSASAFRENGAQHPYTRQLLAAAHLSRTSLTESSEVESGDNADQDLPRRELKGRHP